MEQVTTVVIVGAGGRGRLVYAKYAAMFPEEMKIEAVAELDETRRNLLGDEFGIPKECRFQSAEELFAAPKLADMAFICTQDGDHIKHAHMALEKGYDLLLEKPVSAHIGECKALLSYANALGRNVTVCHVLRYAPFYQKAKEIVSSGRIGKIITISASENVGYWHYSHSYVRGNWRRSDETSPMILAKCCHDMDLLVWLTESRCKSISSMGNIAYFNKDNMPQNAPTHCILGCPVKEQCPYDAEKIYITNEETGYDFVGAGWMQNVIVPEPTREELKNALAVSPYGRCVFRCDNNVADHQTIHAEMENGIHISFHVSAFTKNCYRTLHIMGTNGEIYGELDQEAISLRTFDGKEELISLDVDETLSGHGGGDYRMLHDMFLARHAGDTTMTSLSQSMDSHYMALAAEQSRLEGGKVVDVQEFVNRFDTLRV